MTRSSKAASERAIELTKEFQHELSFLIIGWCNCESWFSNIATTLLRTDRARADVCYYSIGGTRRRIEMVQRLALLSMKDVRNIRHFFKLCRSFKSVTEMRNHLCHAEYNIGVYGSAVLGVVSANYDLNAFDGTNALKYRKIDRGFINEVRQAGRRAIQLSGSLKRFAKTLPGHILKRPRQQPVPLAQLRKAKARRPHPNTKKAQRSQPKASLA